MPIQVNRLVQELPPLLDEIGSVAACDLSRRGARDLSQRGARDLSQRGARDLSQRGARGLSQPGARGLPQQAARDLPLRARTEAAVLVAIVLAADVPRVLLTKRHAALRRHAGEISFPGGSRDPGDATLVDTALREAEEEVALPRGHVTLAGALKPTSTFVTNYMIHPFVATIAGRHAWRASPVEVDQIIELPLLELNGARVTTELTKRGITFETQAYQLDGQLIWGATARIIDDLLDRLQPLLADA